MKRIIIGGVFLLGIVMDMRSQDTTVSKIPFDGIETGWQNGSDRRDSSMRQVFLNASDFIPIIAC